MNKTVLQLLLFCLLTPFVYSQESEKSWIRINNLGYQPESVKVAVFVSKEFTKIKSFSLINAINDKEVYNSKNIQEKGTYGPFKTSYRLHLTDFEKPGVYYIRVNNVKSPEFKIDKDVYANTADFLLKYMRQQRCGFNPFLVDSCHVDDGYIIYHPTKTGQPIDVRGGWHDATDYLQYTTTSANAIFQLLFAYRENPKAFKDQYQANGLPGSNAIPDVIDEAKFGMDWLLKMNPSPEEYYNQIADDRDHSGFRLPNKDTVVYHPNYIGRPVYLATAEKQGLKKYQNRSTGIASTAGKFASAFAIGAEVLAAFYPEYAQKLKKRSIDAYNFGKANPGVSQTAPCKGPYFYEEDNWKDDMELAASSLFKLTANQMYKSDGIQYAKEEPISPWIGRDTVNHYQFYPFVNVAHYDLANELKDAQSSIFRDMYKRGLNILYQRGKDNPFFIGTPFVWCSNNFITAAVTQCNLYFKLTGDPTYLEMEASLRDWLFGCNPWGTSMIVGLPKHGDSPVNPHSSLKILKGYQTYGGLVDGPVYGSIFNSLIGLELFKQDAYAEFQSDLVVYHDDAGDYSTNEPTMDGTASLVYYLSSLESRTLNESLEPQQREFDQTGAVVRGSKEHKRLSLIFSGHEFADGAEIILKTLEKHKIKGSFFLTGDFYRNENFQSFIEKAKKKGHYLGAHSDKHLLYNNWDDKTLLVTHEEFTNDLIANYQEMKKFGITKNNSPYFLPPYEWNNNIITQWAYQQDIQLINFTHGTLSHADYTIPGTKQFRTSKQIYDSILEQEEINGLNGYILLSHLGTSPERKDKFYRHLDQLIVTLEKRGYEFVPLNELISP